MRRVPCVVCVKCVYVCGCDHPSTFPTQALGGCLLRSGGGRGGGFCSNNPGGTLLQKSFKIRSWVPSPQIPYFGGRTPLPSDLKKYRRDLVLSELLSDTDKRPATSNQLQSGVRSMRTSCTRSSSSRVKGTGGRGAGSATCSSWRTSGARSSSSASLTWWCTWHSASSRTCAKIRQRRQHQGPGA